MAIYHLSAQIIGRSGGKSAVASAAYRAGEKIHDEHIGLTFDYTKKQGVDYTEILAPSNAPEWASDRSQLWNEVEKIEKSKNSQLARELNIAIPKELTRDQQIELVRNFAKEQFVAKGMVADLAMHNLAGENPHAHVMLTVRPFNEDKTWGAKSKKEYVRNENGEKIKLKSGEFKSIKVDSTDWNKRETLEDWRKEWAEQTNKALEKAGVLDRIDHRSLKDQGERNRLPQKHIGVHANAMEKRGIHTERGDYNRAVLEINAEIKQFKKDNSQLRKQTEQLVEQAKQAKHEQSVVARNKGHEQPVAPIGEPTRPPIAQQPQPKTLEPVEKEIGNERSTLSVDDWKKEISKVKNTADEQPRTLEQVKQEVESARVEVNKTYEEMSQQRQIVSNLKQELNNAISSLNKCDQLDRDIGKVNKNIENINRFNLLKRNELKALEKERDSLVRQKQIAFGNTSWDGLADKVNRLSNAIEPEKKKLATLENKHAQARKGFDQVNTKMRSLEQEKDHTMGKTLDAREKPSRNQGNKAIGQPVHDTIKALGNSLEKVNREEKFKAERMKEKLDREMKTPQKGRGKGRDQGWEMGDD